MPSLLLLLLLLLLRRYTAITHLPYKMATATTVDKMMSLSPRVYTETEPTKVIVESSYSLPDSGVKEIFNSFIDSMAMSSNQENLNFQIPLKTDQK